MNCDWSISIRAATIPASREIVQHDTGLRAEHDALDGMRKQVAVAEQIGRGEMHIGATGRGLDDAGAASPTPATFWLTSTSVAVFTPW